MLYSILLNEMSMRVEWLNITHKGFVGQKLNRIRCVSYHYKALCGCGLMEKSIVHKAALFRCTKIASLEEWYECTEQNAEILCNQHIPPPMRFRTTYV